MAEGAGFAAAGLLLLLHTLSRGWAEEEPLPLSRSGLHISYPCHERVCFKVSSVQSRNFMVVVSNGRVQLSRSRNDSSKCSVEVSDPRADADRWHCLDAPGAFTPQDGPQMLRVMAGRGVQLHCILLSFVERQSCRAAPGNFALSLTWVDPNRAPILNDSQHQIRQRSHCHNLLTFTPQSPHSSRLGCRANTDPGKDFRALVELDITVSARPKGRRGPGGQGEAPAPAQAPWGSVIPLAIGGIAIVALIGAASLFVMRRRGRRRRSSQQSPRTSHTPAATDALGADDVVYADIVLSSGTEGVTVYDFDSTEYACIQYK